MQTPIAPLFFRYRIRGFGFDSCGFSRGKWIPWGVSSELLSHKVRSPVDRSEKNVGDPNLQFIVCGKAIASEPCGDLTWMLRCMYRCHFRRNVTRDRFTLDVEHLWKSLYSVAGRKQHASLVSKVTTWLISPKPNTFLHMRQGEKRTR
jgi:hypothetical protein